MKSLVFVLALAVVLIASGTAFAASVGGFGGAVKIGLDFEGNWEIETPLGEQDSDTDTGISVAAEGYYLISNYFDIGAGVQYLFEREIDLAPGWEFWFLPVYGVVRIHPPMSDYTPYAIGQIGYSFHNGNSAYVGGLDPDGGFYWGGGAGFIFKRHFLVEILYSESRADVDIPLGPTIDITYRRLTFSAGYNF